MKVLRTIGVAVFVLRKHEVETEVLLLRRADGSGMWTPVAGSLRDGEAESACAVRELREETGLTAERLYAAPFFGENEDPGLGELGRVGVFVAFVGGSAETVLDAENDEHAWLPFGGAAARLHLEPQKAVLTRVRDEFCRRPPDEALRVA